MAMLDNLELIRRIPLFSVLTQTQAQRVAEAIVKRRFERGEVIIEQGAKTDELFVMLDGVSWVSIRGDLGREHIVAILRPGDYIGELSLIDDEAHSATVRARMQMDVLVLCRAEFERCLAENSVLANAVMLGMARRLRRANQKIESLAVLNVHDRVVRALLDAATENLDGEKIIQEKISRQEFAKMVGASREMASRVLQELEQKGLIGARPGGRMFIDPALGRPNGPSA